MTAITDSAADVKAVYEQDGWYQSPHRLDDAALAKLRTSVEAISRQQRPEVVYEKDGSTVRALHGCHEFDEVCGRLVRLPALLGLAEELIGEPVYVYQFKVNMKQPREGAAWPWHQDYAFWNHEDGMPDDKAVNIAIFLDDTHELNGPLKVVLGSHQLGLIGEEEQEDDRERSHDWRNHVSADLEYTVPDEVAEELTEKFGTALAVGPSGSVCAFHPTILHSSSNNRSDDRRAMLLVTYNAVSNAPSNPVRPEFLVSRNAVPLTPVTDNTL
ncbi:phytanoyl-CoA dioxygenase family protein [Streptomyces sp. NPDC058086]|uniref:phytanoyl-CoA dioxygenase family protein n=1 Tax=Streptomyces sp. NPDC058086 TaxID=3346334 RepID=UPI0036F17EFF